MRHRPQHTGSQYFFHDDVDHQLACSLSIIPVSSNCRVVSQQFLSFEVGQLLKFWTCFCRHLITRTLVTNSGNLTYGRYNGKMIKTSFKISLNRLNRALVELAVSDCIALFSVFKKFTKHGFGSALFEQVSLSEDTSSQVLFSATDPVNSKT